VADAGEDAKDRQFVTALARGFDVLRCFTPEQPELGASEIARLTGIPQPTVWRLCYTLLQLGYLTMVPGRQAMRPGIPLLGLGQTVLASQPLGELALPRMQEIARKHEGAVSLGARDGLNMIYLQRCQGSAIILANMRVGSSVPLATSATGWAYTAGLSETERAVLLEELAASRPDWGEIAPKLDIALEGFARDGYLVSIGSMHPRVNSVAVPVVSGDGQQVFALSSGGINVIFGPDKLPEIGMELRALADELSPALSYGTH